MREQVLSAFREIFEVAPYLLVRAPGRANLIGEHTDYNDGFVMPFAVDRAIWMALGVRDDQRFRVHSLDFGNRTIEYDVSRLEDKSLPHWTAYVRGAWWLLQGRGYDLPGIDVVIGSDIPPGGGMSSSAAIGVACIEAGLAIAQEKSLSQTEKALLAVEIEHRFIGLRVGVMDQMASAVPQDAHAVLLDCRSLAMEPVPVPNQVQIVVINSMKERQLVGSEYQTRREQCESAADILQVAALRDADLEMVEAHREVLGNLRYRRARHVVTENARTLEMKERLEAGDVEAAGELLNVSHFSLRDDYEVSVPELDTLTEIARNHRTCYGARIMGGGFGGCAIAMVQQDAVDVFCKAVKNDYQQQVGLIAEFYVVHATPGSDVEYFDA